jgi:hypothetical protein
MDSDLEQQRFKLASMQRKMALEEQKLDLKIISQSSLSVPEVSFLNHGLENKKKGAIQVS